MAGFFDLLNEEFVIGRDDVARVQEDPSCLQEVLDRQRARGIGPPRALRERRRRQEAQEGGGIGLAGWLAAAAVGVLAGAALSREEDR